MVGLRFSSHGSLPIDDDKEVGMQRIAALAAAALLTVLVTHAWAQPAAKTMQGYWMGIDPVDGGDQRRGLVQQANGLFVLAARDTRLTLCDGTDFGIATFEDGVVGNRRRTIVSNNLRLACFGNGQVVMLRVRFDLLDDNLMLETVSRQDGTLVHTMFLHRVSQ
jgi:hypothetical protein